jgi:ribosome maturation factor RimP
MVDDSLERVDDSLERVDDSLEQELEQRVEALGYELVDLERAGSRARPILRLRIDRPGAERGDGVTIDDCARVSRALEAQLDEDQRLAERYTLEVSSPGVERPLGRDRDFERFAGEQVALHGHEPLAGRGKRLQGELLGLSQVEPHAAVRLRLEDGTEVDIPRAAIARAHLIFRWRDRS